MPEKKKKTAPRDEYDSPWKELLDAYFEQFMNFFFVDIAVEINWQKGYTMLEQELRQITREAEIGHRFADKLIRVWKINGEETWVLIHVEVQAQHEKDFSHRTYSYNYRGHDLYNRPVVSLVVFADDNPKWSPSQYVQDLWGCRIDFKFPTVKLLEYKVRWSELEESNNPFAVVVMAHLKTQETSKDNDLRWKWKLELAKSLYKRGYKKQDIINLYRFIDWIMRLPEELEKSFHEEIVKFEKERKMHYVTTAERIGIQKGERIGIEKGERIGIEKGKIETVKNMLKFGLDVKIICQVTGLTDKEVEALKTKPRKMRKHS